ncbi:hypothetical protein QFC22_005923 [Naganishia vaughanmartiniae]|uniref:Uncharacterized protein n=1 Tax=Naganishia vaughanmartiniae TaxID=1424756 RepID=A0ACC2WQQ5_9TREE|nr:hypothetical protein QFC22_005923 [Naganishia vaughanmartiniae]
MLGWTPDEELLVMAEDGTYRMYNLSAASAGIHSNTRSGDATTLIPSASLIAGEYRQYSLGSEVADVGVVSGQVHDEGLVVLTGSLTYLHVKGWTGGRPSALCATGMNVLPHSWTVVSPERSSSRHVEVLASVGETILSIDDMYCIDQSIADTDIRAVEGNHDGSLPSEVEWVGDQAIAMKWDDGRVFVMGPRGEGLSYLYSPAPVLVGEIDGLRIISTETCEFIEKVADATLAVFSPGSTHKAAVLLQALENFEQGSPRANEGIRNIKPDLASAVDVCIEAAGLEPDPVWQKKLLRVSRRWTIGACGIIPLTIDLGEL